MNATLTALSAITLWGWWRRLCPVVASHGDSHTVPLRWPRPHAEGSTVAAFDALREAVGGAYVAELRGRKE